MPEQKSSFGLDYKTVLDSNEGKGFTRVRVNDIEGELDKTFDEGREMGDTCGITVLDPIFRLRIRLRERFHIKILLIGKGF